MPTRNCPPRETLLGFARGDLPDDKIEAVSDHLESCVGCEDTVALFEGQSDTFMGQLQTPVVKSRFADEPEFDRAVAAAKAVAREPDVAATQPAVETQDDLLGRIGDYQLLAKLGHGGMGTVYRALHKRMRRVVALKVLSTHRRHDPAVVERFAREIEAAGKLSHPNIVTAHDAGKADGMHYLVMELVEGVDLHTLVAQLGPLPVADACEIIRQAALGLQHAHEHGLVHRDLKPSNLMLSPTASGGRSFVANGGREPPGESATESGSPNQPAHAGRSPVAQVKILDLGLALLQGDHVASEHITATGQVMGTLDYMAPEQADDSHGVDIRSDIYSLGCTLHKLLTGRAPFSGESFCTPAQKIVAHAQTAPPSVREHREDVPEELAAANDGMLAKDPDGRPATPKDVAALLEPFCEGSDLAGLASQVHVEPERDARVASADEIPVMLRPAGSARKRHRRTALGVFVAAAALLLMVAVAGIVITIKRPGKPDTTVEVPEGSQVTVDRTGRVDVTLPEDPPATVILPDDSAPWPVSSRVDQYGDPLPLGAVARVGTERFRHGSEVDWLSFSADGSVVASCTTDALLVGPRMTTRTRFWEIDSGRMLGQIDAPARFVSGGTRLAITGLSGRLWDVHQGRQVATLDVPGGEIPALDGKSLIGRSRSKVNCVSIYDASTGHEEHVFELGWHFLSVSPSGKLLATTGDGPDSKGAICIWDVAPTKLRWRQPDPRNEIASWRVAFSPDDSTVAIVFEQQSNIGVFDALTGKQRLSLRRESTVTALAFTPDSKALAVAEFTRGTQRPMVQTWDVVANQPIRWYKVTDPGGPSSSDKKIHSLAFSPDGRTLVAGTRSLLHAWNVHSGVERRRDHQYRQAVTMLAISPDSKSLVTGTHRGTTRLWDLLSGTEMQELGPLGSYASAAFSSDGRTLAASEENGLRFYHSEDGRMFSRSPTTLIENGDVTSLAISSDGQRLAALGAMVTLWNLPEKKQLAEWHPRAAGKPATEVRPGQLPTATRYFQSPVFSPDAKMIAGRVYVGRDDVWYWDIETGSKLHTIQPDVRGSKVAVLAFAPDNRMLMWHDRWHLHFHDVRTHREVLKIEWNESPTLVTSNFRLIATVHHGDRIRVWDFATGRKLLELAGHNGPIQSLAFSPDGKYLVSGSDDTTALVWDLELARRELDERLGRADVGPPVDDTRFGHESSVSTLWVNPPGAAPADRAMWTLVAGGARAAEFLGEKLSRLQQRHEQPAQPVADTPTAVPAEDHADTRRAQRAIMALERIGDGRAKKVLQALAKPVAGGPVDPSEERIGNPSVVADWSRKALARLERRSSGSAPQLTKSPTDQGTRLDAHGDPLPAGAITCLGTQRLRQGGDMTDIAHVADGRLLASTEGNSIHLWDTTTGQKWHTLRGHETPILHLAGLADGKTLASCGSRTVRLWNVGQVGSRSRQDFGQDRPDQGAGSNTPDTETLASSATTERPSAETLASSATTELSDIHLQSVEIADVPEAYNIRLFTHARDGSVFVYGISDPGSPGRATIVVAVDRHTGKVLRTFDMDYQYDFERNKRDIVAMGVSPDGKHLAVATGANVLDIWDVETGNRIHSWKGEGRSSFAVAYSPDGKWLAVGHDQGTTFFNARTHELRRTVDAPMGWTDNLVFSDNGAMLASYHNREYQRYHGDFRYRYHGEIRLWDVGSGKLLRSRPTLDRCRGVSLSPDGSNLASRSERRIDLWNTATGEPLETAGAHMGQVNDVVLSPDGKSAATATDYSVHLWDASTGTLRKTIWLAGSQPFEQWPCVGPIVFTPGGDLVISQQKKQVGLFSSDGQFRRSLFALNGDLVKSMAILPEQNRLAFGVLNLAPGNLPRSPQYVVVLDLQTGETVQQFPCQRVGCFLPCGDTLFSRSLEAWDLSTGRRRRYDWPTERSYKQAASPDSRVLATLGGMTVRLWDLISGQVIRDFKVPTQTVRLAVSPGGRIVATGSDDTTVRLWDAASGAELAVLEGHGSRIESLTFSSDGRRLATASQDHTALVWDLTPHLQKLKPPAPVPDDPMLHRSWHALACQLPPRPAPLKPAPLATLEQQAAIARSIGQLEDEDNATALQAAAHLEAMGYLAVPALRRALSDTESPAKRKRIESILAEIESPQFEPPERQTTARAIRVLETVATDHSRSVLEDLAAGAPDASRTKQARAAIRRFDSNREP